MLAQSAKHATVSASPAAAILGDSGGKNKKSATLASLFPDILSQARNAFGTKADEGAKSISRQKGEERASALSHAAIPGKATVGEGIKESEARLASVAAKAQVPEASRTRSGDEAPAGKTRDKRHASGLGDPTSDGTETDAGLRKAVDEKRRGKSASEPSADEAAALRAALAASRAAPASAAAPKAKGPHEIGEAELSAQAVKKGDRGSSEPRLTVLDLRRSAESRRDAAAKDEASPKADDGFKEAIREIKTGGKGSGQELVRELSLDARSAGDASSSAKADSGIAAGSQDFRSMLAERMREAWNGEIVKSAHIVLKDGDAGTIRLRLRPESLGNVKIELNLSDNNISGRITVESDEAKSAFERNMSRLSDAFMQGGFDSAKLEVSVGGSGSGSGGANANADGSAGPFYSERLKGALSSSADPATAASAYARRGGAVDILA